ncbi:U2-snRNP associated splicing factor [Sugiyamaella lignohabitans]|uniref:U2-snRNP associated splicing factor n=1 Tax=Sugiyamaella lignohabitans TaxID=796027 RepID=A0A167E0Q1_9ASCO|nr:U2-snRNP associated splicing factor [Sugiyamaella lignohabitans]ANB13512.1 U2-snRNP associated splicing factor [Sugiyamaella lignohabitans]
MATPINLAEFRVGGQNDRGRTRVLTGTQIEEEKPRSNRKRRTNYLSTPLLSPKEVVKSAYASITTQQRKYKDRKELSRNYIQVRDNSNGTRQGAGHNWFVFPEKSRAKLAFNDVLESWPHFLEKYGRCVENQSDTKLPACFKGSGLMIPPESHDEPQRVEAVKEYLNRRQWNKLACFRSLMANMMSQYQVSGLTISLVDRSRQIVKFEFGFPISNFSRSISIDGHAILSKDHFVLLDASQDWRMKYNPFVHGHPFIKFYAAVPLMSPDRYVIGAVAVFDSYIRQKIPENLIETLKSLSRKLSDFISAEASTELSKTEPETKNGSTYERLLNKNIVSSKSDENSSKLFYPQNYLKLGLCSSTGLKYSPTLIQSYQILNELKDCQDGKAAIAKAAKMIAGVLELDVVYAVEVHITESYSTRLSRFPFPTGHKFPDNISKQEIIGRSRILGTPSVSINFVGGYNIQEVVHRFDNDVHQTAFDSPYGIQYNSAK